MPPSRTASPISQSKSEKLFALSIYYVVLFEGSRSARSLGSVLLGIPKRPAQALGELQAWFSTQRQVVLLDRELVRAQSTLLQKVGSFLLQVADFLTVRLLDKHQAFRVLTQILNFAPHKLEHARLKHDTFLDYYVSASHLECHRGHLRVDDYFVKVLTLKEPSAQSFPLIFKRLLEVQANFYVVTEWKKQDPGATRRAIQAKRRHFHNTKRSFFSQVNLNDAAPQDALLDDWKESQVRELGEGIKEIELRGNYFGEFSLTVVLYDLDLGKVDRAAAEFYKVFSVHDAELYDERYNLLNAFLAAVPGNHAFNLRTLYLLNTNYADFSFLFTLHSGRAPERAPAPGISGGAGDLPQHALLPEPALSRRRAQHDPRPDRLREVVLAEFFDHQLAEIRAAHLHLRSRRKFRKPDATLRRLLRQRRRGIRGVFHQPILAGAYQGEPGFPHLVRQGLAPRLAISRT